MPKQTVDVSKAIQRPFRPKPIKPMPITRQNQDWLEECELNYVSLEPNQTAVVAEDECESVALRRRADRTEGEAVTVYCIVSEEQGGYPIREHFASLDRKEAEDFRDSLEQRKDELVWLKSVSFPSLEEAQKALGSGKPICS